MDIYKPNRYWENRLRHSMNLEGVGCLGKGMLYNTYLYRSKVRAMEKGLRRIGIEELMQMSVLDLGTGTGFWIDYFLNRGAGICVGVDITEASVDFLSRKFSSEQATFVRSDLSDPNLPKLIDKNFDLVTAIDVLYHIISDDLLEQTVKNISQLINDQGWFVFSDVLNLPQGKESSASHVKWRSRKVWEKLIYDNGFLIRAEVPMYVFMHAAITGPLVLKYCINIINYRITPRISKSSFGGKIFLSFLSALDQLTTSIGGTSLYMVFAQKVRR